MQPDIPIIHAETILNKIYNFLIAIKDAIFPNNFATISPWIVTIMTFLFVVFIVWAIYIRVRIYEMDEHLDGAYKGHFIKAETRTERVNARWKNILTHFSSTNPNDWRAAIIDADTMLDELVTSLGYTGESLGAKLTSIRLQDFPTLQMAWDGHKIRNIIAHEGANYNLTERQKELARKNFETVFREAGVI